jgi:hypothetical protein
MKGGQTAWHYWTNGTFSVNSGLTSQGRFPMIPTVRQISGVWDKSLMLKLSTVPSRTSAKADPICFRQRTFLCDKVCLNEASQLFFGRNLCSIGF